MGDWEEYGAVVNTAGVELDGLAEQLETALAQVRDVRARMVDLGPSLKRLSGYEGDPDQLVAAELEGFGFGRLERARRRMLEALHDPLDDVQL